MSGIVITNGNGKTANVTVKSINNIFVPKQTSSVTLTTQSSGVGTSRLDQLLDVREITPEDNQTLVYDSATDKYIVKFLDLDGGTF